jgi:hypothetical protein
MSKDKRKNHHRVEGAVDRLVDREAMLDLLRAFRYPATVQPPESIVRIVYNGDKHDDQD